MTSTTQLYFGLSTKF